MSSVFGERSRANAMGGHRATKKTFSRAKGANTKKIRGGSEWGNFGQRTAGGRLALRQSGPVKAPGLEPNERLKALASRISRGSTMVAMGTRCERKRLIFPAGQVFSRSHHSGFSLMTGKIAASSERPNRAWSYHAGELRHR